VPPMILPRPTHRAPDMTVFDNQTMALHHCIHQNFPALSIHNAWCPSWEPTVPSSFAQDTQIYMRPVFAMHSSTWNTNANGSILASRSWIA
jgi:hypothetical protein